MANIVTGAFLSALLLIAAMQGVGAAPVEILGERFGISFDIPNSTLLENNADSKDYLTDGAYKSEVQIDNFLETEKGAIVVSYSESPVLDGHDAESVIEELVGRTLGPGYEKEEIKIGGYPGFIVRGTATDIEGKEKGINLVVVKPDSVSLLVIMGDDASVSEPTLAAFAIAPIEFPAPVVLTEQMAVKMGGEQFVLSFDIPNSTIIRSGDNSTIKLVNGSYESTRYMFCTLETREGIVTVHYFEDSSSIGYDAQMAARIFNFEPGYGDQEVKIGGYSGFKLSGTRTDNERGEQSDVVLVNPSEYSLVGIVATNDADALEAATKSFAIEAVSQV